MKTSSLFLASLIVFVTIGISACKHSTSPNSGSSNSPLTATVNGQPWKALVTGVGHPQGILDLSGSDDSSTIDIQLSPSIVDTGTYPIDNSLVGGVYSVHLKQYASIAGSGTVHLTAISTTRTAGTFSFHAKYAAGDTVVVTNGQMNMAW